MSSTPIPLSVPKPDAVLELARRANVSNVFPYAFEMAEIVRRLSTVVAPIRNEQVQFVPWQHAAEVTRQVHFPAGHQLLHPIRYLNGRPDCFPPFPGRWPSPTPEFSVMTARNGYLLLLPDAPIALSSARQIIEPYGSRYRGLVKYYDADVNALLDEATVIAGNVLVLCDDVWGLNFCHWLCDWLPRLAFLGSRAGDADMFVAVSPLAAPFQMESLVAAGFTPERIIQLTPGRAIQAQHLLVPSDLGEILHPSYKGAPWAVNFLRGGIAANLPPQNQQDMPKKLYVSRQDASGRRVLNEPELIARLDQHGFQTVALSGMPLAAQAAMFNAADKIIALHGAALANIVFARRQASVLEIFPQTYGTPAYAVIATALGLDYATYISQGVQAGTASQVDDIVLDLDDFFSTCADYL